jgi:hypothetical protein
MVRYPFVACILFNVVGIARAEEFPPRTLNPVVLSEARSEVGRFYLLNADCSSAGDIVARVTKDPAKGQVDVNDVAGFTNYSKDDQRYQCNARTSSVVSIFYTSAAGFKGTDNFEAEIFYPNRNSQKIRFRITVK